MDRIGRILGYVTTALIVVGLSFKMMKWPGANVMILLGVGGIVFGFLPMFFSLKFRNERDKEKEQKRNQELEILLKQLEIEKIRAEESKRYKAEFLRTMSHEIRSPMAAIIGILHLLSEKQPTEEQKKYIKAAENSAESLLTILNDVLDAERLEARQMKFLSAPFSLAEVCQGAFSTYLVKAAEKNLYIHLDYDKNVSEWLIGDANRIRQILNNLIDNAIKFTEKGGITIMVKLIGNRPPYQDIQIDVVDTGNGIRPDFINNLFVEYSQTEESLTRKNSSGLGLAISKKIAELMHGEIKVQSVPGKGSVFTLKISLTIPSAGGNNFDKADEEFKRAVASLRGVTILIVDDIEENRLILRDILQLYIPEITVIQASNGREALQFLRAERNSIEIMVLDLELPDFNGFEVMKEIIGERKIKTLLLTASIIDVSKSDLIKMGIDDIMRKPYLPKTLIVKLSEIYASDNG